MDAWGWEHLHRWLRCAARRPAITAAEQNEVFCVPSFRILPRLEQPAFGSAQSRVSSNSTLPRR